MKKGIVTMLILSAVSTAMAAGNVEAGAEKAVVCAACHGQKGVSVNPEWPNLAGQGEQYLFKQLQNFKSGERKNPVMMGQVAALSEEDMKDLAAYFAAQEAAPAATNGVGDEPDEMLALGEAIYRGGDMENNVPACAACHGPTGAGIAPAAFPRLSAQHAKYTRTQLLAFYNAAHEEGLATDADKATMTARANDPNQMMRGVAGNMTPKQIEAVSYYIQGLN